MARYLGPKLKLSRRRLAFLHAYVYEQVPLPLFNHPDYFLIGLRGPLRVRALVLVR